MLAHIAQKSLPKAKDEVKKVTDIWVREEKLAKMSQLNCDMIDKR